MMIDDLKQTLEVLTNDRETARRARNERRRALKALDSEDVKRRLTPAAIAEERRTIETGIRKRIEDRLTGARTVAAKALARRDRVVADVLGGPQSALVLSPVPVLGLRFDSETDDQYEERTRKARQERRDINIENTLRRIDDVLTRIDLRAALPDYSPGELVDLARDAAQRRDKPLLGMIERHARTRHPTNATEAATLRVGVQRAVESLPEIAEARAVLAECEQVASGIESAFGEICGGPEDVTDRSEFISLHGQEQYHQHRETEKQADAARVDKIAEQFIKIAPAADDERAA